MKESIILIGAGLSGSLLAILLAKRGFSVEVYERRPDRRIQTVDAGKSINLAVSARGRNALEYAGVTAQIEAMATPMYGRMNHLLNGTTLGTKYSIHPENCLLSVSRPLLNEILMTEAEKHGVVIHFNKRCEDIDFATHHFTYRDLTTETLHSVPFTRIMACDGANSAVRNSMKKHTHFEFSEKEFHVNYKELCIPASPEGEIRMERNWLHIWGRDNGAFMMIALPNKDNSFTCTLFMPIEGEKTMANINSVEKISAFFQTYFPDAYALMPTLLEDFTLNPTSSLNIVLCYPWVIQDRMALVGDACHAVVPFYGQGVNASFEDCIELDRCIAEYYPDWAAIFSHYQENRKANADAISQMAQENFEDMSKSNLPESQLRRAIELELEKRFPHYKSQYELVSFSLVPYTLAQHTGRTNKKLITEIISSIPQMQAQNWDESIQTHTVPYLLTQIDWETAGKNIAPQLA